MAALEIQSNLKCITSGNVPTTTELANSEFAFGVVGGDPKLYGNVNGTIVDFSGDKIDLSAVDLDQLVSASTTWNQLPEIVYNAKMPCYVYVPPNGTLGNAGKLLYANTPHIVTTGQEPFKYILSARAKSFAGGFDQYVVDVFLITAGTGNTVYQGVMAQVTYGDTVYFGGWQSTDKIYGAIQVIGNTSGNMITVDGDRVVVKFSANGLGSKEISFNTRGDRLAIYDELGNSSDILIAKDVEYANTSEIVDNAITLTGSSTISDLVSQILANKTKVSNISANDANIKRLLGTIPYMAAPSGTYNKIEFKVISLSTPTPSTSTGEGVIQVMLNAAGYANSPVPHTGYIVHYPNFQDWTWRGWNSEAYPIGAIYESVNNTTPASLFGGTWTALSNVGANKTASLIMTNKELTSSSFSYYKGTGSVTPDEMRVFHNADYSIIQVTGRLNVTPTSTAGGAVGIKFNIGSNIIKKAALRRQCGFYYDGNGAHESIWTDADTNGNIFFYNNSTYINLPTARTTWSIWLTLFNKSSDGDTVYRWKRIA